MDLWGESNAETRERWREFAGIIKDTADEPDRLLKHLQVRFFGAVAGGRGIAAAEGRP
jgi:hypothetical protein